MTELVPSSQVGDEDWLITVFARYYVAKCRDYQMMRGLRPTFSLPKMQRGDAASSRLKLSVKSLARRGYNPLLAVTHAMRRFYGMHEPEPPKLTHVLAIQADPEVLHEEALAEASQMLQCDNVNIKQIAASCGVLFDGDLSETQFLYLAVPQLSSKIMQASILWHLEGQQGVDKDAWREAVVEYLKCPEAYAALQMPFVREQLLPLIDYRKMTKVRR